MFIRQQIVKQLVFNVIFTWMLLLFSIAKLSAQKSLDSLQLLKKVTVTANKTPNTFTTAIPVQLLNHETLQQINAESIADAAKYFSGVLIKDYGGIGGLKTISVRSLGALNTGLLYDGIPVADAQSGQIDLSKFSSTFVQSLELSEANPQQILLPAKVYSFASVLAVATNTFNAINFTQTKWQAGFKQGLFGLWQPFAGIYLPVSKTVIVSATAEATWATGNYSFNSVNGSLSQKEYRINSDIHSLQGEINVVKQFSDSSQLQTKLWNYTSGRGLPGAVIFYNNISAQRLWDNDLFIQSRYQKKISNNTSLLISAKYSSLFTKYKDSNFNAGAGIEDRYTQNEIYISAAISKCIGNNFLFSYASDFASANLTADIMPYTNPFANPTRNTWWNSIAVQYSKPHWQINASLLNTIVNDKTETGTAATNKNEVTPTIAASYKINNESPFLFRAFYKNIFRLPTFNDLYYTYISNINPKIRPEYSKQYNIGIAYSKIFNSAIKQFSISMDAYYNTVNDKIVAFPNNSLILTVKNVGKVHIKGLDVTTEASGKFSSATKWSARIAYTLQQAQDVTDPLSTAYKDEIPYTPNNSGSALAMIYYKNWVGGYSILFSGNRYTLGDNNPANELQGWDTQDIFISRNFNLHRFQTTIKAELNNVFSQDYVVIKSYPMPGRSYKISITFNNL